MTGMTTLDNSLVVVTETVPGTPACNIALRFAVGSAHEPDGEHGIAHFAEHVAFKGAGSRNAAQTAVLIADLGGSINAWTSSDATAYEALVAADDFEAGLRLVAENATSPHVPPEEFERERGVIVEEILMNADDDGFSAYAALAEACWPGPWGRPTSGTVEDIRSATRDRVAAWLAERYAGSNAILAVAGPFDHDDVVRSAARALGHLPGRPAVDQTPPPPGFLRADLRVAAGTAQSTALCAWRAAPPEDPSQPAAMLGADVLGGAMDSRLWTALREERGLVYDVAFSANVVPGAMMHTLELRCAPENIPAALEAAQAEIDRLASGALTQAEVDRAFARHRRRRDISGGTLHAYVARHLGAIVYRGRPVSFEEEDNDFRAVRAEQVCAWAATLSADLRSTLVYGPAEGVRAA